MKVFNLSCEHDHQFEGWFASVAEYDRQIEHSLLQCPMCDSGQVRRLPSAPRLNLSKAANTAKSSSLSGGQEEVIAPTAAQMQAMWLKMARQIQANTEDVGERFVEEARRIHYKEAPERGIRGVASPEDAAELADEGIEVMRLPVPVGAKEPLQ